MFHFKQFSVLHDRSSMKVGTDAVLLGCLANVSGDSVLEVGCGCGVISLMLAQRFSAIRITAIDIHQPSIEEAFTNFQNSLWKGRLQVENRSLQMFSEYHPHEFDGMISNPPFFSRSLLPADSSRTNARHTTTLSYEDLLSCSENLLTRRGKLWLILPSQEELNFKKTIVLSRLRIHQVLRIFGTDKERPKRMIFECGFDDRPIIEQSFWMYDLRALDRSEIVYSAEYLSLVEDFLML